MFTQSSGSDILAVNTLKRDNLAVKNVKNEKARPVPKNSTNHNHFGFIITALSLRFQRALDHFMNLFITKVMTENMFLGPKPQITEIMKKLAPVPKSSNNQNHFTFILTALCL